MTNDIQIWIWRTKGFCKKKYLNIQTWVTFLTTLNLQYNYKFIYLLLWNS